MRSCPAQSFANRRFDAVTHEFLFTNALRT
jgi:hypothetical protein